MQNIQITVISPPGCGKSTIGHIISEALRKEGFSIDFKDTECRPDYFLPEKTKSRIQYLSSKTKIKIDMIQSNRESFRKEAK